MKGIAEEAVLGSIILDNNTIHSISHILEPSDFEHRIHGAMFQKMLDLSKNNKPIDNTILCAEGFSLPVLLHLADSVATSANVAYYAEIVKDFGQKRKLKRVAAEISSLSEFSALSAEELVLEAERLVLSIRCKENNSGAVKTVGELSKEVLSSCNERDGFYGKRTGLQGLDNILGGLQRGETVVLAGRPSMGKSSVAAQILLNRAEEGDVCLFFSLEMGHEMCALRMISQLSGVPMSDIKTGRFGEMDRRALEAADRKLQSYKISIDRTGSISAAQIRSVCRRVKAANQGVLDLVVVDYLQLCGGSSKDGRERDVAETSAGMKALSKEFDIPVLLLSQLNRSCETREDKRPMLSDLRESGAIEQDADAVIMVYRPYVYNREEEESTMELILRKNRNGPLGTAHAVWTPKSMSVT